MCGTLADASGVGRSAAARHYAHTASLDPVQANSIVMTRSNCYGTCPAYRPFITPSGLVEFQSLNPGEPIRTAKDRVPPGKASTLFFHFRHLGFTRLPEKIQDAPAYCAISVTDYPLGCHPLVLRD